MRPPRPKRPCSPRRPCIWSTRAASGSGRCWCCSPPSSATRTPPEVVPAAVVVELTHLATLYHDDVMDEAAVRRGAESANSRWDNTVAILTGDFLFARASRHPGRPRARRRSGCRPQTFERLVTGQIRETVGPRAGRGPDRPLPGGARRQDRLADRHRPAEFGAHVRRRRPRRSSTRCASFGEQIGHRLPALRRHPRHRLGDRPSPARRRAPTCARASPTLPVLYALRSTDPADARLRELLSPARSPTTPSTPRRWPCCAPTPRSRPPTPSWAAGPSGPASRC